MKHGMVLLICVFVICASCSVADATLFKSEGFGVSIGACLSIPQQEFANVGERGFGFNLAGIYFPGAKYLQGIRMELGGTWYGTDSKDVSRGQIDTRHYSYELGLGLHFSIPAGPAFLYASPMGGIYHYRTTEVFDSTFGDEDHLATKFSTTKVGWSIRGGIFIAFGEEVEDKSLKGLDIGVKYHTIRNMIRSEIEGKDRNANDLAIHVAFAIMPKWWEH
jgi:hypothetical protein